MTVGNLREENGTSRSCSRGEAEPYRLVPLSPTSRSRSVVRSTLRRIGRPRPTRVRVRKQRPAYRIGPPRATHKDRRWHQCRTLPREPRVLGSPASTPEPRFRIPQDRFVLAAAANRAETEGRFSVIFAARCDPEGADGRIGAWVPRV